VASHIQTFNCLADTYLNRIYPSSNYGTSSVDLIGGWFIENGKSTCKYFSFYAFDISIIPVNKTIKKIELFVKIVSISAEEPTGYNNENDISLPYVVNARRVYGYNISELESSMFNLYKARGMSGDNNIIDVDYAVNDSSLNISAMSGSYVSLSMKDLARESNEVVIGLSIDDVNYRNVRSARCTAYLGSKDSSYIPYLQVTYEDYVPTTPYNLTPNNTVRNKQGEIKLAWQFEDTTTNATQAAFELAYSTDNFVTQTVKTGGASNSYTITANTFIDGKTVKWKVRITDSNGDVSNWSDISSFTIGATTPSAPSLISPINTIVNSSDEVYFRWRFVDIYGYTQAKYDLQYRKGQETEFTVNGVSISSIHILAKKVLCGGNYSWRVRCYNAFSEVGPYSEWSTFYSIGQPEVPTITSVTNHMHPTITWSAYEQDVFTIRVYKNDLSIFDSGEQPVGESNTFTINEYLANGNYKIGLKIRNIYGFWSNEVFNNITISTINPPKPSISGNVNDLFIALTINSITDNNIIYRKGIKEKVFKEIVNTTDTIYLDYSVPAGENQYFIRSITDDSFTDSDIITLNLDFDGIVLSGSTNYQDYLHLYTTKDVDKRKSIAPTKEQFFTKCNGREYPVLQSTMFKNQAENHEYFIFAKDYDQYIHILNDYDTVLYRNNYGYSYLAGISNPLIQEDIFGYIVTFTLTRLGE
jgi:hypothetical protein